MHEISSYRGNRLTNTAIDPQTVPITIHCAAASAQCTKNNLVAQYLNSVQKVELIVFGRHFNILPDAVTRFGDHTDGMQLRTV